MYISKKNREIIKNKFNGKCAYSGTDLLNDWQIDHVKPIIRNWYDGTQRNAENHNLENMFPVQKLINHYKGSLDLETFRTWYLAGLHTRLKKLPKKTNSEKAIKKIAYLRQIAEYFNISENNPFSGKFYFENSL